jgi:hypothetical protein
LKCYSKVIAERAEKAFLSKGNILLGSLRVFGRLIDKSVVEELMGFLEGVFFEAEKHGLYVSADISEEVKDWLAEETVKKWNTREVKDKDTLPVREGDADAV